jgi:hypothetical protein
MLTTDVGNSADLSRIRNCEYKQTVLAWSLLLLSTWRQNATSQRNSTKTDTQHVRCSIYNILKIANAFLSHVFYDTASSKISYRWLSLVFYCLQHHSVTQTLTCSSVCSIISPAQHCSVAVSGMVTPAQQCNVVLSAIITPPQQCDVVLSRIVTPPQQCYVVLSGIVTPAHLWDVVLPLVVHQVKKDRFILSSVRNRPTVRNYVYDTASENRIFIKFIIVFLTNHCRINKSSVKISAVRVKRYRRA